MPHQACFHQPLGQQRQSWKGLSLETASFVYDCCNPCLFALSTFISSPFSSFHSLSPLPSPPIFPSIIQAPHSSLMLPKTQSSSPFLFYPLSISCFVCKPQGREMGEKHSLCTTVTKDWWVIATYVPVSLLPQKNTHLQEKHSNYSLPAVHLQEDTYWHTH